MMRAFVVVALSGAASMGWVALGLAVGALLGPAKPSAFSAIASGPTQDPEMLAPQRATQTESPPDAGASYIAFARDFADFRTWERIAVEGAMLPVGVAPGPTSVYANARRPRGVRRFPVGTILVKAVERGAPHEWVIHAMVKRGVPYNADGAVGWEFFELAFDEGAEAPHVVWRGTGPPSGHGYAALGRDAGSEPVPLVCNDCHAAAWQTDGVLTPALAPIP